MTDIATQVKDLLFENFGLSDQDITDETKLIDDLNLDSLDFVELQMTIEEMFALDTIDDDDFISLVTVGDLIGYVTKIVAV